MNRRTFIAALVTCFGIRPALGQARAPRRDGVYVQGQWVAPEATIRFGDPVLIDSDRRFPDAGRPHIDLAVDDSKRKPFRLCQPRDVVTLEIVRGNKVYVRVLGRVKSLWPNAIVPHWKSLLTVVVTEWQDSKL